MVYLPLNSEISDLCQKLWTEHSKQVTCHITKSSINQFQKTFEGAIFHCEDKQSSSLRIYTARASTTNPSNRHSKILPFSNQCPMTQLPLCHHLLRPSKNDTENPITGQLVTDDDYRRVTSWQNGRKNFEVADPLFPLWTFRSVPCLTSLLDSSSS